MIYFGISWVKLINLHRGRNHNLRAARVNARTSAASRGPGAEPEWSQPGVESGASDMGIRHYEDMRHEAHWKQLTCWRERVECDLLRELAPAEVIAGPDHQWVRGVGGQVGQEVGEPGGERRGAGGSRGHWDVQDPPVSASQARHLQLKISTLGQQKDCFNVSEEHCYCMI